MSILAHSEIRESVAAIYAAGGLPKGDKTGWPSVDKLYTVGMNQWTIITGNPGAGKSEWLDALMVNLAKTGEWRFFIYSPENYPVSLHHAKILEKYLGKPFDPGITPRMEPDELEAGEDWMEGKFYFCKPNRPDMESILVEGIDSVTAQFSTTWKTGIVLDPWNYLEHRRPAAMTETEYVSEVLSNVLEHVRKYYIHMWLVAHPAKMMPKRDGTYSVPTPRDIAGSAHFWNKADNCITVHRDQKEGGKEVEIHVQKVRWKHMGRIGIANLDYNRVTGQYREQLNVANYYNERQT